MQQDRRFQDRQFQDRQFQDRLFQDRQVQDRPFVDMFLLLLLLPSSSFLLVPFQNQDTLVAAVVACALAVLHVQTLLLHLRPS